jgi:hypothetical protein
MDRTHATGAIDRRSYLELAGLAVPAVLSASMASESAAAGPGGDGYEVVEARGQTIEITDGETFENKLIDYTTGEGCTIDARDATDWTIRNVGFHGRKRTPRSVFGLSDTGGGTSVVENVYLGDGADRVGEGHGPGGIFVGPEHAGTIEFRNVNVQAFPNNGIYASAPATAGGGAIHIDGCYGADCGIAHYRVGGDGDTVTNSSVELTSAGYDGRGVWAWAPGPVTVADCEFAMDGRHYSFRAGANDEASELVVSGTEYDDGFHGGWDNRYGGRLCFDGGNGTDPTPVVPEGCPASVAEAFPSDAGSVLVDDQESDGETVTVNLAFYNAADFVVVVESDSGDVLGHSETIAAGDALEGRAIELASPLAESQRVTVRLHRSRTDADYGAPIESDGKVVRDRADVIVGTSAEDYRIDGEYTDRSVFDAIEDWRNDGIDDSVLFDVIGGWRSS